MTSIVSSNHRSYWSVGGGGGGVHNQEHLVWGFTKRSSSNLLPSSSRGHIHRHYEHHVGAYAHSLPRGRLIFSNGSSHSSGASSSHKRCRPAFATVVDGGGDGSDDDDDDAEDGNKDDPYSKGSAADGGKDAVRENLERIVGRDDSKFSGIDLATLIRNKYGRSYDVQLIKKEFMGRNLLALNVMWKYMEQRSFPLTEEEYLLRLDDVANTLKCWGAVSHIRNSLEKLKERPRIGKAVSIFIDMDETGGRANEWIYK
ncbi:unnamed protein product [Linum tenue]|uniref:Uncharacterized protein n=1 Tax=Linum tenue TaxID=586396 RepID=A0AAV0J867_9ROSI|nr:unnamed protein product [Linum tenue]